ncbi:MAG: glycogen synthase [Lysobacterales bacterium]|jgi:starch synthase
MAPSSPLRICLAASEFSPLAKTGGLADVTAALSAYFAAEGHDVRVLMPLYASVDTAALDLDEPPPLRDLKMQLGTRVVHYSIARARPPGADDRYLYLLRCPELYGSEIYSGPDEHLRFILLSRAAVEMCQLLEFGPDIFHCHDWHTALVPLYLKTVYAWDRLFAKTRSVLTLHNIGYQGVFGMDILEDAGLAESTSMLDAEDLHGGRINFLKAGIRHADLLTTVSPTYAREILEPECGMGLEHQLGLRRGSLVGILNGVDYAEWNPATDRLIPHRYSQRNMAGKERNKKAVMKQLKLDYEFGRPLVGMVTRLTYQKGIELVEQVVPDLLRTRDWSLAVLGNGEAGYEKFFNWLHSEFPGRVSFWRGFDNRLAHRIEAGSDLFLMPSRYEPCGLNQMYSLRYGTVPVVRATGGLADSVQHFDLGKGTGTGVVFHDFDANGLRWALNTALDLYANRHGWLQVVSNGMEKNYSWEEQGRQYVDRFRKLLKDK